MRHLKHPATVIATVALFAALSGGAIAGTVISGNQIKNHSIPAKKLTASAVRQLSGHRGPAGPHGGCWSGGSGWNRFRADGLSVRSIRRLWKRDRGR
jgi:hypothetical protein